MTAIAVHRPAPHANWFPAVEPVMKVPSVGPLPDSMPGPSVSHDSFVTSHHLLTTPHGASSAPARLR